MYIKLDNKFNGLYDMWVHVKDLISIDYLKKDITFQNKI